MVVKFKESAQSLKPSFHRLIFTMGTIRTRQDKIEWVKKAINSFFTANPNGQISIDKLVYHFVIQFNSSKRTAQEVIDTLVNTGYVNYDEEGEFLIK